LNVFKKVKSCLLYLKKDTTNGNSAVRQAFEEYIAILGEETKRSMMFELTVHARVNFDEQNLSIVKLHEGLKTLYGAEVADIITEEVILRLDRIVEERRQRID
jgi:hypothetical protein